MTDATGIGMAVFSAAELIILCLGGWLFFVKRNHTYSEAAACGIISAFMLLAGIYQAALLLGTTSVAHWAEWFVFTAAILFIIKHRNQVRSGLKASLATLYRFPMAGAGLAIGLGYLSLQGFLIPVDNGHWEPLARLMTMQRQGTFVANASALAATSSPLLALPENQVALTSLFLKNHTDLGLGLLGIGAFATIAFATYALSRRYAWPPTAMTVTLIAISCPRFVFASTGPGLTLIPAAVAIVGLLTIYRLVESPNALDLGMLALTICFLIGDQVLWLAFPCVMLLLSLVLLFRRHGGRTWLNRISQHRLEAVIVGLAALFFSRLWIFPYNGFHSGIWESPGRMATMQFNADGIQGTAANLFRYLLQSIDITAPIDAALYWMTRISVSTGLQEFYTAVIYPVFDDLGAAEPFRLSFHATEYLAWFGPLCFLLLPIATVYGLRYAPRRLKAVLVALVGYVFLIALIAAWQPVNVRYITVVIACSIFCIALFLPPWRLTRGTRRLLRWSSFTLFFYAALFNADRPALDFSCGSGRPDHTSAAPSLTDSLIKEPAANGIWIKSAWGRNRWLGAERLFGDRRTERIAEIVGRNDSLVIVYREPAAAFPFLLHYPQAIAYSVSDTNPGWRLIETDSASAYFLFIDRYPPDTFVRKDLQIVWQANKNLAHLPGTLYRVRQPKS